jgi:acetoin utilization protein AcuC
MPRATMLDVAIDPLLVFGPRSTSYDFGPNHPLTPRRFGPGIDLLRTVGAVPGLAPEPADEADLLQVHTPKYVAAVRRLSANPSGEPEVGIAAFGDDPPFAGMHDAAAAVAGGSLRAIEAILRGDVEHAFHPGGGLHHAMPSRASGFCIYNDPALAISAARRAGLRVLYIDLDVHHGDGVQAIHLDDPGVLTVSIHESGRTLFPGTGFVDELGAGVAAGTSVNLPLEAEAGEGPWLAGVRGLLPTLAAYFGPDLIVSQHGADSHAWDPLAHLRVTTTAMGAAARLVDTLAHRHAGGRWLATGGGGYDVYRVVPRAWALTWLAGAHREVPEATDPSWRARWATDAGAHEQGPPPATFEDPPNAGLPLSELQGLAEARSLETLAQVRSIVLPRLLVVAEERGWWHPLGALSAGGSSVGSAAQAVIGLAPTVVPHLDPGLVERLSLAPRTMQPANPTAGREILLAAVRAGARVSGAVLGDRLVGIALVAPGADRDGRSELLWIGVAPDQRRRGIASALLAAVVRSPPGDPGPAHLTARLGIAERDVVNPLPLDQRLAIAGRLLDRAGFAPSGGRADGMALTQSRSYTIG